MYRILAKKYPNNEIRVRLENRGAGKAFSYDEEEAAVASDSPPPLLLDIRRDFETKQQDAPSGFGSLPRKTKFGLNAKNTLLRLGGVFDKLGCEPENFIFLTGTLPGSTTAAMVAISMWSGWLVHRLKAWLNKYQQGERLDFYVWERQKRGALHLHYCVYCPDSGKRKCILERFKSQWVRLLNSIGKSADTDMYARSEGGTWADCKEVTQAYAQEVYKSVVAYLAKYCSKEAGKDEGGEYYPSRWWGCSRSCTKHLKEMSEEVEIDCLTRTQGEAKFEEHKRTLDTYTNKSHTYRDKVGSGINVVAYTHKDELESIWQMIKPYKMNEQEKEQAQLRRELNAWVSLTLKTSYLSQRFSRTVSGLPHVLAAKWLTQKPLSLREMGMLVDSCAYVCKSELQGVKCSKHIKTRISRLLESGYRCHEHNQVSSMPGGDGQAIQGGVPCEDKQVSDSPSVRCVQLSLADCG